VDDRIKENWRKVKDALETAGKTDSFFYRRAAAILKTGRDPDDPPAPNKI
jgi:hypothetical protein